MCYTNKGKVAPFDHVPVWSANASRLDKTKVLLVGYFRLFIVATGCPSERLPQRTVSSYGSVNNETVR